MSSAGFYAALVVFSALFAARLFCAARRQEREARR